jgi:hypothetical protein
VKNSLDKHSVYGLKLLEVYIMDEAAEGINEMDEIVLSL